jgi:hypothetical protein
MSLIYTVRVDSEVVVVGVLAWNVLCNIQQRGQYWLVRFTWMHHDMVAVT